MLKFERHKDSRGRPYYLIKSYANDWKKLPLSRVHDVPYYPGTISILPTERGFHIFVHWKDYNDGITKHRDRILIAYNTIDTTTEPDLAPYIWQECAKLLIANNISIPELPNPRVYVNVNYEWPRTKISKKTTNRVADELEVGLFGDDDLGTIHSPLDISQIILPE